jgi:peptidoglycan hydrolase-like protein with peptidoglycan-binding domain
MLSLSAFRPSTTVAARRPAAVEPQGAGVSETLAAIRQEAEKLMSSAGSAPAASTDSSLMGSLKYIWTWMTGHVAPGPAPKPAPTPAPAPKPGPTPAPAPPKPAPSFPAATVTSVVKKGANGGEVRLLQERLKAAGFDPGAIDGAFGPNTERAVRAFQQAKGLGVDGVVGAKTWGALNVTLKAPDPGTTYDVGGPQRAVKRQGKYIGVSIAARFDSMVAAAARDGVSLQINSGMRTRAEQQHLYDLYKAGKGNIAAKPGTSNHEKGEAIDFTNTSGAWAWLKRNSTRFGFHNFPPEPWHYSLTGG